MTAADEEWAKEFPLHTKLVALDGDNDTIGQFLEWLGEQEGIAICEWSDEEYASGRYYPARKSIEDWIGAYFGIDPKALSKEKDKMLARARHQIDQAEALAADIEQALSGEDQ